MSAPVTGLDSLPTSEAQLQRLMVSLQQKELNVAAEIRPNNITVAYDIDALTATFTATNVPITVSVGKPLNNWMRNELPKERGTITKNFATNIYRSRRGRDRYPFAKATRDRVS